MRANFRPHISQVNSNDPSLSGFENANAARFCSALICLAVRLLVVPLPPPPLLPPPWPPPVLSWCSFLGTTLAVGCFTWYSDAKAALLPRPGKKLDTAIRKENTKTININKNNTSRHSLGSVFQV